MFFWPPCWCWQTEFPSLPVRKAELFHREMWYTLCLQRVRGRGAARWAGARPRGRVAHAWASSAGSLRRGGGRAGEHPSSSLVARPRLGFVLRLGGVGFGPGAPGVALGVWRGPVPWGWRAPGSSGVRARVGISREVLRKGRDRHG